MGAPIIFKGSNAQLLNSGNILRKSGFIYAGLVTETKSALFTAEPGKHYLLDSSGGIFTVTLPAGASGHVIRFSDVASSWQAFPVTLDGNGAETISGDLTLVCDVNFTWVELMWDTVDGEWKYRSAITPAAVPLANTTTQGLVSIVTQEFSGQKVFTDGVAFDNTPNGNLTILTDRTHWHPNVTIDAADTWTVDVGGTFLTALTTTINGTLTINGTMEALN